MRTAEEILKANIIDGRVWLTSEERTIAAKTMREYAQQECEKVRQDCADNAKTISEHVYGTENESYQVVDKQSILQTPIELT